MTTRLCVVRHGETDWNIQRRIQGQLDVPLNAHGRSQAAALARSLRDTDFSVCYSSDLLRAQQTAQTVCAGTHWPLQLEADLRERHYGKLQGLTAEELALRDPQAGRRYAARDLHDDFGGGESLLRFARRVRAVVTTLARRHAGGALLLVTHGGVLDVLYRHATGRALETPRDFSVPNVGVNWFDLTFDGAAPDALPSWHLRSWADQRHLQAVAGLEELPG